MSGVDNTVQMKLKFKITTKGIRDASEDKLHGNTIKDIGKNGQRDRIAVGGNRHCEANVLVKPSMLVNPGKRKPETSLDGKRRKKRKMDRTLKLQCSNILKELINHPAGWIFSEPVDPVKLNIPDYFSIISEPMDLGSIKHKLEGDTYFGAEEFVADVRLTFSNAMLYNPPGHQVHNWAKKLDGHFSMRWKSVEAKLGLGKKNLEEATFVDYMKNNSQGTKQLRKKNLEVATSVGYMKNNSQDTKQAVEKNCQDTQPIGVKKVPLCVKPDAYRPMSFEEKRKFRSELVQVLDRKMMENMRALFQKFGFTCLNKEKLDSYIDSTDDETLWKLRREIKILLDAKDGKVKPAKIAQNGCPSLKKPVQKEHFSQSVCASAKHRQSVDSIEATCSSCVSLTCHCRPKNDSAQASTSDISSERSSEHDHCGDSKLGSKVKCSLASHTSGVGVDSDGPGVVLNEENSSHLSTSATAVASVEGGTSVDAAMSPKRALRAAMLKNRFAETIFRATRQTLLDHGKKADGLTMQRERERLEKEKLEEIARIEAECKAAKARCSGDDLKMQREKERAAARVALEKMEKTVDIYENLGILKDLEILFHGALFDLQRPVEKLGLYIKDDYLEEEDEDASFEGEKLVNQQ